MNKIEQAIKWLQEGPARTQKEAAIKFNVAQSTLCQTLIREGAKRMAHPQPSPYVNGVLTHRGKRY